MFHTAVRNLTMPGNMYASAGSKAPIGGIWSGSVGFRAEICRSFRRRLGAMVLVILARYASVTGPKRNTHSLRLHNNAEYRMATAILTLCACLLAGTSVCETTGAVMDDMNHTMGMDHSAGAEQDLVGSGSTTRAEAIQMQQEALSGAHHSAHMDDSVKQGEHLNLMNLMPDASDPNTAVAINGGSWFNTATWANGTVPGAGQDVYIPYGVSVVYDGVSTAELGTVGVDGGLHFAVDKDTRLEVESLLTGASSTLTIGTQENPVRSDVSAEIVITDSPINLSEDPSQLGHGVVTHGAVEIHGAAKAPYLKLAVEPEAGDKTLVLEGDVGSWKVGDSLVVMGTQYVGKDSDGILQTQDEEVKIVAIDAAAGTVTIDRPLQYDHTTPDYVGRDGIDNELSVYVGNSTRNVTFSSENPEGVRGHVMFMHNADVEVRFTEFHELGRTDKSIPINTDELWDENDWSNRGPDIKNGPGADVIGTARNPGTENPEGRYALHIHRTGAEQDSKLAVLEGNSVTGSPGWGIVHHDSHAAIDYNFVYGVAGAGIVSEDGNETGQWIGNFVTSTVGTGRDPDRDGDANVLTLEKSGDFGIEGVAYESQARQIIQQDNIAANSKTAWMFNTSETSTQGPTVDVVQFDPSGNPFEEKERFDEEDTSIIGFSGNQMIAVEEGIFTGHRNIDNATDIQQTFSDLTAYNVKNEAVHIFNYTNEYVFKDTLFVNVGRGFKVGDKVEGINLSNVHIEDAFEVFNARGYNADGVFVDVTSRDVDQGIVARDQNGNLVSFDDRIIDSATLKPVEQITFKADSNAKMTIRAGGSDLDIRGTLTDSVGEFRFHANTWYRQDVHTFDGLQTEIRSRDMDYILEKYGAIENGDGSWDLAFYWWVGDRLTGENQAVFIPLRLEGFSDSYLEQYKVNGFTPPSNEVQLYYEDGIQFIEQDFKSGTDHPDHGTGGDGGDGGSNSGHDDAMLRGSDADDTLTGTSGNDIAIGAAGDDTIKGAEGNDELWGGSGSDTVFGGDGNDALGGGGQNDQLSGGGGADTIFGGGGKDQIGGGAQNDWLSGGGGNDCMFGGAGDDQLFGGSGDDEIWGGEGSDVLDGGDGNDILYVGSGEDILVLSGGADQVFGFGPDDRIDVSDIAGINDFSDVQEHLSGTTDVVIGDGLGNTMTLIGVQADQLDANDFIF